MEPSFLFRVSSVVEQWTVNPLVVCSNHTPGVLSSFLSTEEISMNVVTLRTDQSPFDDLHRQIVQDIGNFNQTVTKVKTVVLMRDYFLLPEASPDIDVFDVAKNIEEETVLYGTSQKTEGSSSRQDFPSLLRKRMEIAQIFLSSSMPTYSRAIRVIVDLFNENDLIKTLSYNKSW